MQVIIILLLIVILMILVSFKNYVTGYFKKIESDIQRLQEIPPKIVDAPKVVTREVLETKAVKDPEDYWRPSFTKVEEPVETPIKANAIVEEKRNVDLPKAEEKVVQTGYERTTVPPKIIPNPKPSFFERNPDLEKFIGENLVSKIGIAILVLAIGFFVKFAIDNNWIGPVGRVAIGILCGGILAGLAHRLRNSYKAFSSVLLGGGLAIFYFTITLAYHQFHLFSQTTAFIIMIVITVFAVALSILYDRQELAIIALVGGFAAPFLVSNGSGNYKALFTYLVILNSGLLVIAYHKTWRLMNLLAFIFTVILFASWTASLSPATPPDTYGNGILFASAFYLLFFFINIANNIRENKKFIAADFSILLINTGWFFFTGLYCLTEMKKPEYRGLFTIFIGVFNLIASYFLFRKRKVDSNVLYLLIGITLTFISLTAPIQLHGHNITLFWASESVLLFWLYQKSTIRIILYASLIVWCAMIISLLGDWIIIYSDGGIALPIIINKGFITGLYSAIATYVLFMLRRNMHDDGSSFPAKIFSKNIFHVTAIVLLFVTGALEVNYHFRYYFPQSEMNILYLQLYSYGFVVLLLLINNKIQTIKISTRLQKILLTGCLVFFLVCMGRITALQNDLLQLGHFNGYFSACWIVAFLVGVIFYQLIRIEKTGKSFAPANAALFVWPICAGIVIFLSFESYWVVNQIFYDSQDPLDEIQRVFVKTCLPILWGLLSFCFMWLGMKYKFKPLRIISLVLFLITLVKLFIFDISNIPVAGKIAAFFCLGVLLLIVSFMYQKLKKIIILDGEKKHV